LEALVLIIAGLLELAVFGVATIVPAFAMAVVDLIGILLHLLFGNAFSLRRPSRETRERKTKIDPIDRMAAASKPRSRLRHLLLVPLAALTVALLAINFAFFEATTRWAVEKFAGKAGFAVRFEHVEGNLFTGRFEFRNLTVLREPSERAGFDLEVAQVALDVNLLSVIFRPISLERLEIASVSGQVTKPAPPVNRDSVSQSGLEKIKPKRRFVVETLEIHDARLNILGQDGTDSNIEIVNAMSRPFRSDLAVFDFFFRSTVDARVDGHPINISSEIVRAGRRTSWDIKDFPVSSVAGLVPRAPIDWLDGGTISAIVRDEWSMGSEDTEIDMDWNVTMRGVHVNVPTDAGPVEKLAASALGKVVNGRSDDVSFEFTTVFDEGNFSNTVSLDAAGLWRALVSGIAKAIAARRDEKDVTIKKKINGATTRLKSLFGEEKPAEQ
jgi:hypothetical protein